ncbi:hypothetical protein [Bacillus ndiopicus]|uniref:hypothetical protein n=1 Tax=Bacillus ndiopicus TaxID=1347368 RepID=UPI0005A8FA93|nr:hypothetical protein [Bacillus ndiopicus]
MSAIDAIAKIGLNGKVSDNEKIQYDIPKGPLVGAPDDYVHEFDLMEKADYPAWSQYKSMMNEAL